MTDPTTLRSLIIFYADPDNCLRKLVSKRWPDGIVTCPRCGSKSVTFNAKRRNWQCSVHHPMRAFSVKEGWDYLRGFPTRSGQMAYRRLDDCQLQERYQQLRD